ncbi:hypothetical protein H5410_035916 [Solanum commersonii]|uniref:Uncharacterized protein n=1 Tax=Solanum commersonii TaxID=4109 RepID=A0A9J5Y625_SOLCO|nr:hypothetical protein H5410_035916 [Solanum commersonii]
MKEGGIGFRSLIDVSNALYCKLWWNLGSKSSLWASFMMNKYCKKLHPVISQSREAYTIWKKMVGMREVVEHQISSQIKGEIPASGLITGQPWEHYTTLYQNLMSVGINIEGLQLSQVLNQWWTIQCCPILKKIFTAVPAIIMWHLWRRRNNLKNENTCSFNKLVYTVNTYIRRMVKLIYPKMQQVPTIWSEMVEYMERYKPKLYQLHESARSRKFKMQHRCLKGQSREECF